MNNNILYAAGLFDGEGSVSTLFPFRKQARLEIQMVNKPTLERFARIVGGVVNKSYEHRRGRRTQWRWRVCDKEAVRIARLLLPYSTEKKEQLQALIKFKESTADKDREFWAVVIKNEKRKEFTD